MMNVTLTALLPDLSCPPSAMKVGAVTGLGRADVTERFRVLLAFGLIRRESQ
jgi:hypothetical protein